MFTCKSQIVRPTFSMNFVAKLALKKVVGDQNDDFPKSFYGILDYL
jgi:hypothetical protein